MTLTLEVIFFKKTREIVSKNNSFNKESLYVNLKPKIQPFRDHGGKEEDDKKGGRTEETERSVTCRLQFPHPFNNTHTHDKTEGREGKHI